MDADGLHVLAQLCGQGDGDGGHQLPAVGDGVGHGRGRPTNTMPKPITTTNQVAISPFEAVCAAASAASSVSAAAFKMNPPIVLLPFSFVSGDRRGMPRAVRPGMYTASRFYPALIGPESGIFRGETGGFAADAQCCSVEGFNQKTNSHQIHLITGSKKSKIPYRNDDIYKNIWNWVKKELGA